MRHKTRAVTLTMLAGAMSLGGCRDDDRPKLVGGEEDCAREMGDAEGCRNAARQAQADHEKSAPRYGTQKECEEQFGPDRCRRAERDGSSWFMPAMTGFMIGRMMDGGGQYRVQPACANGTSVYTNGCGPARAHAGYAPATSALAGRYSAGSFAPEPAYTSSWTAGKVAASRAAAGTSAVARGGFGASAAGHAAGE